MKTSILGCTLLITLGASAHAGPVVVQPVRSGTVACVETDTLVSKVKYRAESKPVSDAIRSAVVRAAAHNGASTSTFYNPITGVTHVKMIGEMGSKRSLRDVIVTADEAARRSSPPENPLVLKAAGTGTTTIVEASFAVRSANYQTKSPKAREAIRLAVEAHAVRTGARLYTAFNPLTDSTHVAVIVGNLDYHTPLLEVIVDADRAVDDRR